ncbi:hypothetical protein TGFOU_204310B [Toxoplasma gondii FOU]|uniref:Uncharacterized protein n=1 Tax=Toxoplasma gondii FOU TaxID=943167 RepID=A0A086K5E6_TOXGO|nr:hypothetical protein TGFOU_204310B [Toxoplasma gondii FOU]
MFLEDHATQCMQFDLEYRVNYETRLTPFEVGHHSWMCRFARLPTAIFQRQEGARDGPVGTVYARSFDFKDWVGFPPDEVAEMVHLVRLQITEPRWANVAREEKAEKKAQRGAEERGLC